MHTSHLLNSTTRIGTGLCFVVFPGALAWIETRRAPLVAAMAHACKNAA